MFSSCTLQLPSIAAWKYAILMQTGLAFVIGTPLGILLYYTPAKLRMVLGVTIGVTIAVLMAVVPRLLQETHWMGSFLGATFGFSTFFKCIAIALGQYPSGADNSLKAFVMFFIALPEPVLVKGKLKRLTQQEVLNRFRLFILKILGLFVVLSFFNCFGGVFPSDFIGGSDMWYSPLINGILHLWFLYLFSAFCLDFSNLSYSPLFRASFEDGFRNPLLESRSLRDCWGFCWDLPIQVMLKRSMYIPIRKASGGQEIATVIIFGASGSLHEYTFLPTILLIINHSK